MQTVDNNLKKLGVVESKRSTIRKGFVHELLNAQDTGMTFDLDRHMCQELHRINRLLMSR